MLFGEQEGSGHPAQYQVAIAPTADISGLLTNPGLGTFNHVGGGQAAMQARRQPTEQVLGFISSLLETGALIYFDDWRLCRASRTVGESAAALTWLQAKPDFELIEFDRDSWQSQWFIFQRARI
jgi:hypothetical protein